MTSVAPRRSARDRKNVQYFSAEDTGRKRKRAGSDGEDLADDTSDSPSEAEQDEQEDDFDAKKSSAGAATRKSRAKTGGPSPTKKSRTTKQGPKAPRKPRAPKDAPAQNISILDDNPLFNAVLNPAAALQSTVEDFLQSLEYNPNPSLAELVTFILRCCGSNDTVDADQAVDADGIVDALDHFTESLKNIETPIYPLTSKNPAFKKFRKSLCEFLHKLIDSAAEMGTLYSSELMDVLKRWVISMSSSHIRSFRHTATVIALEIQTGLCQVAASLEKESDRVGRQREGDKKRKAGNKTGGAKSKELELKANELREHRMKVAAMLKEFFNGVFIHRYRDTDGLIRADCVKALGAWLKKFPSEFLAGDYLRYIGWVLSDLTPTVRVEAVRALDGVYAQTEHTNGLNHFTERFKSRLLQMAKGDTDLSIRVAVIKVLSAIDEQSLLDDEERDEFCSLVKDSEARVRNAIAPFVKIVFDEMVEAKLVEKSKPTDLDQQRVGFKVLGSLLANLLRTPHEPDSTDNENDGNGDELGQSAYANELYQHDLSSDISQVVFSLWSEFDILQDWEGLLEMLLLDHSAADNEAPILSSPRKGRKKAAKPDGDEVTVDDLWRLEDQEEGALLEVLISILRLSQDAASGKKEAEDKVTNEISRQLINALPRLFHRHQTDEKRIEQVLRLPHLMNLDLYLDMRMVTNYSALWDDIIKQFLSHTSLSVLRQAMAAMQRCMTCVALAKTNSEKISDLEEDLSVSLREVVGGRDEIDLATFSDDEVLTLTSLAARISILLAQRDMVLWIEEDEGGNQSSGWDIINGLFDRGRLGHKHEEALFGHAAQVLLFYTMWKYHRLQRAEADNDGQTASMQEAFLTNRDLLRGKLADFALGSQSNATEMVKTTAFRCYLDLHILFCGTDDPALALPLDDEDQYRCAGLMQAEIERYYESVHGDSKRRGEDEDDDADDDEDADENGTKVLNSRSHALLAKEYAFMAIVSSFMRALLGGQIHPRHGANLLPFYSRLGAQFDICCKKVVGWIRDEGFAKDEPDIVVEAVSQAMQDAFALSLELKKVDAALNRLAKLLVTMFTLRGTHLTVLKRLSSAHIVEIHLKLTTWLAQRIHEYDKEDAHTLLKRTADLFKFLVALVNGLDTKDAVRTKALLTQHLAENKIEVSANSDTWDSLRAYEKKLGAASTKDKAATNGKPRKKKPLPGHEDDPTSAEESEVERLVDSDAEEAHPASPPRPRPRPTRKARQLSAPNGADDNPPTPPHPQSQPTQSSSPRKRRRSAAMDEEDNAIDLDHEDFNTPSREPTPAGEIIVPKKKRVRH
ncbi:hypothetical protein DL96DRAFT_1814433 [Flagelloscypha sp. PMI_526]|nr:hypothetical protein DL96DRAFT_1814433 [Flagelloscypha sp. PMI_526]